MPPTKSVQVVRDEMEEMIHPMPISSSLEAIRLRDEEIEKAVIALNTYRDFVRTEVPKLMTNDIKTKQSGYGGFNAVHSLQNIMLGYLIFMFIFCAFVTIMLF